MYIKNVTVPYFVMFKITLCVILSEDDDEPPREFEGAEIVLLCIRCVFVHKTHTVTA